MLLHPPNDDDKTRQKLMLRKSRKMFSLQNMLESTRQIYNEFAFFPKTYEIYRAQRMQQQTSPRDLHCNVSILVVHKNALSTLNSSPEVIYFSRQFANRFQVVF